MRVIWSLEYIPDRNFNLQVECLTTSVKSWKDIYPEDHLVLYCDEITLEKLNPLRLPHSFSEVNKICYRKFPFVKSKVFWASSKLRVFLEEKIPFLFLDNDFHIKKPIKDKLNLSKLCYNFSEVGESLYPTLNDPTLRTLKFPFRLKSVACNISFLYVPDVKFIHRYANTSLDTMNNLSKKGVSSDLYMLFAEQLLLKNYIIQEGISYQCLRKDLFYNTRYCWEYGAESHGIFSKDEVDEYYSHEGPAKNRRIHT